MIKVTMDSKSMAAVIQIIEQDVNVQRGIRQGMFKAGNLLKKTMRNEILRGQKTGKVYRIRRGKRLLNHTASSPGQTAASVSGIYQKSIGYQLKGWEQLEFGSQGSDAEHAAFLENGTSRMSPRPGIKNTVQTNSGDIVSLLENEIRKAIT